MIKYTIGLLAAIIVVAASAFLLVAWRNGRNAEAGPGPVVTVIVDDAGVAPVSLEVGKGKLIQLTLDNRSAQRQTLSSDDAGVEQLLQNDGSIFDPHAGSSLQAVRLTAAEHSTNAADVRFRRSGDYTLSIASTGNATEPSIVRVHAK